MKIIIATGGSGGHIFPALQVAAKLREQGGEIFFVGTFGNFKEKIEKEGYRIEELGAKGLTTNSLKTISFSLVSMLKSTVKVNGILKDIKPQVVVGFGGYGAFPVIVAANLSRYPTLIHEQNVIPGRANAFLAKFVDKIAISFEKSRKFFPRARTILSGCPSRLPEPSYDRRQILKDFGLQEGKNTFLICGGSQGSQRINNVFMQALPFLASPLNLQVIHLAGQKDYAELKKKYAELHVDHFLTPFLDEMDKAYAVADLAIARAGAVTVTEVSHFGLPTIFIPYPYAGGHQKENALVLKEVNAAMLIEEKDLTPESLGKTIHEFLQQKPKNDEIKRRAQGVCLSDAADRLAREVMALTRV